MLKNAVDWSVNVAVAWLLLEFHAKLLFIVLSLYSNKSNSESKHGNVLLVSVDSLLIRIVLEKSFLIQSKRYSEIPLTYLLMLELCSDIWKFQTIFKKLYATTKCLLTLPNLYERHRSKLQNLYFYYCYLACCAYW